MFIEIMSFTIAALAVEAVVIPFDDPRFDEVVVEYQEPRRPPRYPYSCMRGKSPEGTVDWVDLKFDIESNGRPTKVRVIEATESCFHRVARKSVQDWRYTDPLYRGARVKIVDVKTRINFTLLPR